MNHERSEKVQQHSCLSSVRQPLHVLGNVLTPQSVTLMCPEDRKAAASTNEDSKSFTTRMRIRISKRGGDAVDPTVGPARNMEC